MDATEQTNCPLWELSDPDFIALWARQRLQLALGNGNKTAYDTIRAEYERRLGRAS